MVDIVRDVLHAHCRAAGPRINPTILRMLRLWTFCRHFSVNRTGSSVMSRSYFWWTLKVHCKLECLSLGMCSCQSVDERGADQSEPVLYCETEPGLLLGHYIFAKRIRRNGRSLLSSSGSTSEQGEFSAPFVYVVKSALTVNHWIRSEIYRSLDHRN